MRFRGAAIGLTALAGSLVANAASAATVTIDFEDRDGYAVLIEDGYGGIDWGGKFLTYDTAAPPFTPSSGTTAAYFNYETGGMTPGNGYTQALKFSADVLFKGVYFSGDPLPVTLSFYRDGVLRGTRTATTGGTPTLFTFDESVIDELRISGGAGNFVFDDLSYELAPAIVPEPASWAMMIAGFGLAGATVRRRGVRLAMT